jgi:hypothetical protein
MKPEAVVPGVVPVEKVLARSPDAVVAVVGSLAYPMGFEFSVGAVLRIGRQHRPMVGLGVHHWPGQDSDEPLPDEFLRVGVRFSDGRVATNVDRRAFGPSESAPTGPMLMPGGGGGGTRRYDMTYWVWPLPPPGPLTFVCEWPAFAIPESHVDIEAQLILDAAVRAIQVWPEDDSADQAGWSTLSYEARSPD